MKAITSVFIFFKGLALRFYYAHEISQSSCDSLDSYHVSALPEPAKTVDWFSLSHLPANSDALVAQDFSSVFFFFSIKPSYRTIPFTL